MAPRHSAPSQPDTALTAVESAIALLESQPRHPNYQALHASLNHAHGTLVSEKHRETQMAREASVGSAQSSSGRTCGWRDGWSLRRQSFGDEDKLGWPASSGALTVGVLPYGRSPGGTEVSRELSRWEQLRNKTASSQGGDKLSFVSCETTGSDFWEPPHETFDDADFFRKAGMTFSRNEESVISVPILAPTLRSSPRPAAENVGRLAFKRPSPQTSPRPRTAPTPMQTTTTTTTTTKSTLSSRALQQQYWHKTVTLPAPEQVAAAPPSYPEKKKTYSFGLRTILLGSASEPSERPQPPRAVDAPRFTPVRFEQSRRLK